MLSGSVGIQCAWLFRELILALDDAVTPGNGGKPAASLPGGAVLLSHHLHDFGLRSIKVISELANLGEIGFSERKP